MPPPAPHPTCHLALCRELIPTDASATPSWLLLCPAGDVPGRDGRTFHNPDPAPILTWWQGQGTDIPVDLEHATHLKAPQGDPAPAFGWIDALEVRDGAVWGRVTWNAEGAETIADRAYRYYSPAYLLQEGRVVGIPSVGLTNRPNLPALPALNQSTDQTIQPEPMDMSKLCAALGLDPSADEATILAAITSLQQAQALALQAAQQPPLDQWVPRADYDLALNRVATAEQALAADRQAKHAAAVELALNSALTAGKISPATKGYYQGQCATPEGLAAFERFTAAAPAIVNGQTGPDVSTEPRKTLALNAQQRQIAAHLGISEAAYLASLQAQQETAP